MCVCVCVCMYVRTYIDVKFVRRTQYVWSWPSTNLTHTSMYSSSGELITFGDDEGGLYLWADKAALEAKSMTQSPISGVRDEIHCFTLWYTVIHYNTPRAKLDAKHMTQCFISGVRDEIHCVTLWQTVIHYNTPKAALDAKHMTQSPFWVCVMKLTATHCNTLQRTATHCNTLQHTATHCTALTRTVTYCNTPRA